MLFLSYHKIERVEHGISTTGFFTGPLVLTTCVNAHAFQNTQSYTLWPKYTINLKAITHSLSASTVFLQDNFTDVTQDDTCAHTSYPS